MKKRKNNKKILILSLLLILFLTITATQAAEIQDNTTTTSDSNTITSQIDVNIVDTISVSENEKISASTGSFTELNDLINKSGNTIELQQDYKYNNETDFINGITIDRDNITIKGYNHIIDGNGQATCIFNITANNVTLDNIQFKNIVTEKVYPVSTKDTISPIIWEGHNGTITNSKFADNNIQVTTLNGGTIRVAGAIFWSGENATLRNLQIKNNEIIINGDRMAASTPGVWITNRNAIIENCEFTNNKGPRGALGIWNINSKIINSIFNNNTATYYGGAAINSGGANTTIINSKFINSIDETNNGGAVYLSKDNDTIINSTFNNNTAGDAGAGAGIYCIGANLRVINSEFYNNNATGSSATGGAIRVTADNCTIINSTFVNNEANSGGATYLSGNYHTVINSTYINNRGRTHNGALRFNGEYGYVSNSKFYNNSAAMDTGAVSLNNNAIACNCIFINNTAGRNSAACGGNEKSKIFNCTFIENNAYGNIIITNSYGEIFNNTFINNKLYNGALGVIYVTGNENKIYNCIFINTTNINNTQHGASIEINGESNVVYDSIFINNSARFGAGIFINGNNHYIFNCTLINNTATDAGGAIYVREASTNINIISNIFINNIVPRSGNYGGAMHLSKNIANITIKYNTILNADKTENNGIYIHSTTSNLDAVNWYGKNNPSYYAGSYLNAEIIKINDTYIVGGEYNPIISIAFRDNTTGELISESITRPISYGLSNPTVPFIWKNSGVTGKILGINTAKQVFNITNIQIDNQNLGNVSFNGNDFEISQGNSFKALQILINRASVGDTIELNNDYVYNNQIVGEPTTILINKTLKIVGDISVSGADKTNIFTITANNVEINGLTLTNARSPTSNGGAIYATGNNTKINNVKFINNIAGTGSAIYAIGDNTELNNNIFTGNSVTFNNGVIIYIKGKQSKLNNNTITQTNNNMIIIEGDDAIVSQLNISDVKGDVLTVVGNNSDINNVDLVNVDGTGIKTTQPSNINIITVIGGNGIVIDANGDKTNITSVTATNHTGNIIKSAGNTVQINNINANNGTGVIIDVTGDYNIIQNINSNNHTDEVIKTNGKQNTIQKVTANNNTDDIINSKGESTIIFNVNAYNSNGAVADLNNGANAAISTINVVNHTGDILKNIGPNAQIDHLIPVDANNAFSIPANISTSTINFTIDNMPVDAMGTFFATVDNITKNTSVVNGVADAIIFDDLTAGNHTVSLKFTPTGNKYTSISKEGIFTVVSSIDPEEVIIIPENVTPGSEIPVILPANYTGNVTLKIDNETIITKELVNGSTTLPVGNLTPGNHNIEVSYEGNQPSFSLKTNVTVPTVYSLVDNKNIIIEYSGTAFYTVRVLINGAPVADNETVIITFNGLKQTVKTVNGTVKFPVNTAIAVAKYTITAEYQGKTVSNTVDILNIINANKLKKLKKSKKVNKVKVSLLKVDGKVQAGKKLTLKLKNKKVATAKTNKKGTATFKVKKKSLKKFKKGKKVVATVVYGADTVSKKIKIA